MRGRNCLLTLRPDTPDEIEDIVLKLKNSKSTGIDNINTLVIKLA